MRQATHAIELAAGGRVCDSCHVAGSPAARLRGLLGREELPPGEGLFLKGCYAVHTWFMRFPIDVVFLDADLCVVAVVDALPPWHSVARRRARHVLELAAGEAARREVRVGEGLALRERMRTVVTEDVLGVHAA